MTPSDLSGRPTVADPSGQPSVPDLADLLASLHVVRLPLRVRFRGIEQREVALLRGPSGWGEFAPFVEYPPAEAAAWLAAAVEAGWGEWPAPMRDEVPVNATVPAVPAERVPEVLARFGGCTTAKVKVAEPGQTLSDDLDRVAAVREVLGTAGRIRVDANGAWSVDQAREAVAALGRYGLEYVEQPCAQVAELAALRRALARDRVEVPVAADESIRKAQDPLEVARREAADLVVVKVAPLGGVAWALAVVQDCGLPAVVSSAIDSSVGIRAGVALAAALPELPHACGLGTVRLLREDVSGEPLVPVEGALPVRDPVVDLAALARHRVEPERESWWRERLTATHAALTG